MRRVLAFLAVFALLIPACDEPVAPVEDEVKPVLAPVDGAPTYALAVANAAVEFGPVALTRPSSGIWESVGSTSDPTIRDARLSQTCGGTAETLGGQLYQMTRYFGEARCYPYIRFTATGLVSLRSLRFKHIHNHNPGFPTNPSYEVQLQIRTVGLTSWRDLGVPVALSSSTYGATATVGLLSMLLDLAPGTYDIRWVPRGLNGSDTNTEFFGLRSVSLGLTTFPAPLVTLAAAPGADLDPASAVYTATGVSSDAGVVTGQLTQNCGGSVGAAWGDGFVWHVTRQFGPSACYPEILFTTDRITKLKELEFHHGHNHNYGYPTYPGYRTQLQLWTGGGWVNVGGTVVLDNSTSWQTDEVSLEDRLIPPGQHRLRWVPTGLAWGATTGTEFLALRSVVLSMEPVPTPPMKLSVVPESLTNAGPGVYEATAATSDPTLVTGRLTQSCDGYAVPLGGSLYQLTRTFGACYPEIRFTTTLTTTPSGIQFQHAHNHNWGFPTYPSYSAQLQLYRNGGWTDVGAPILLSNQTSNRTDVVALGGLELPAGEQRLRWIPVGLHGGTNTGTEFFALRDIVLGLNNAPPVAVAAGPSAGAEGAALAFSGSGSTDPDGQALAHTWNFGDGSPTAQGESVTHAWADNGTYTVTLTVTDGFAGISMDTRTVTIANIAPTVAAIPDVSILEGEAYTHTGSFTDPGADSWTATVDYGDGAGAQALTLSGGGGKALTLSHTYARAGTYTVTVRVTDEDSGVGAGTATVTVGNVAPVVQLGPGATIDEGANFSGGGSFTDPGSATWTAIANYGDGSSQQALTLSGKSFALSHTYTDNGTYTVGVSVSDGVGEGYATMDVVVVNVAPTVDAGPDGTVAEGSLFASAGSFTDPGADSWTATADYGEGAGPQTLALDATAFALAHAYDDNGVFDIAVSVADDDGGTGADVASVEVTNVAPTATFTSDATAAEGSPFTLALVNPVDPSTADVTAGFAYALDCGDGAGLVAGEATRSCQTDQDGTRSVRATIRDKDDGESAYAGTVSIYNVPPTVSALPDIELMEGETYAAGGSFTDPGADPWSATVAYEGTPEPLPLSGTTFALSHLYGTAGTYALEVVVFDDDASGRSGAVVVVLTAAQAATAMSGEIQDLVSAGDLTLQEAKALTESLASAAASLAKGNTSAAMGQMGAFDNHTTALVNSGRLDAQTAAVLLDYSSRLQESILAKGGGRGRGR